MDIGIFVPITLFACITYAIKAVVDARVRRQMVESNGSEELVRSIMESEESRRRHSSLRWGLVLMALGLGFGAIAATGLDEPTPTSFAIVLCALGLGNIAAYGVARRYQG